MECEIVGCGLIRQYSHLRFIDHCYSDGNVEVCYGYTPEGSKNSDTSDTITKKYPPPIKITVWDGNEKTSWEYTGVERKEVRDE